MSMIQYGYLIDWDGYRRALDGPRRNPSRLEDWIGPLEALRPRLRKQSFPEWRINLDETMEESRDELLSEKTRITTLEQVRDLHFLALTDFCRGRTEDFEWWWDTLKTGLGKLIGQETADEAVLGVRWEGPAWGFAENQVNYQFGFVLPERVPVLQRALEKIGPEVFKATLATIDWSETYGCHGPTLDAGNESGTLRALERLKANLARARSGKLGLYTLLD